MKSKGRIELTGKVANDFFQAITANNRQRSLSEKAKTLLAMCELAIGFADHHATSATNSSWLALKNSDQVRDLHGCIERLRLSATDRERSHATEQLLLAALRVSNIPPRFSEDVLPTLCKLAHECYIAQPD